MQDYNNLVYICIYILKNNIRKIGNYTGIYVKRRNSGGGGGGGGGRRSGGGGGGGTSPCRSFLEHTETPPHDRE